MFLINSRWIKKELDGDIHNFTELNTDINCFNDDDIEVEIDQEIANLTFTSEMEAYRKLFNAAKCLISIGCKSPDDTKQLIISYLIIIPI